MPFRIFSYDSASYMHMISHDEPLCPVIFLVLNFSSARWGKYTSLYDCLGLDESSRDYANDYKIKVVDAAFLPKEVRDKFISDFAFAADWDFQNREKGTYDGRRFLQEEK